MTIYKGFCCTAALVLASMVGGCSSLPNTGPTSNTVLRGERKNARLMGFSIVQVAPDRLPAPERAELSSTTSLEQLDRAGRVDLLGPGDVLQINIFEVGVSLFGSAISVGGGGRSRSDVSVKDQPVSGVVVDDAGYINLPYIGRMRAAGRTTDEVRRAIIAGLRGKSQEPQALVTVSENVTNTVTIGGLVMQPGRRNISLARERILDVVAASGGVKDPATAETAILRFTRGDRTVETYLAELAPGSPADLQLLPGDRIEILNRERSYTVFGAARTISEIKFQKASISLSDAIARAGGPDGQQADPEGVFVFRYEKDATVPGGERPMIYQLNLMKASSYFLSQRFMMHDKDVIYVASARSNQTRKLVEIINFISSPFIQARALAQ